MSDARKQLIELVAEISELLPEVRLGQLICNLTTMANGQYGDSIWDVEDEELLAAAKEHVVALRARAREMAGARAAS